MTIIKVKKFALYLFSFSALVVLSACGGGSGGGKGQQSSGLSEASSSSAAINTPPTVSILFPPENAFTQGSTVFVRGTAKDDGAISNVTVNGSGATSNDGFLTWSIEIPLEPGVNSLSVTVTDDTGLENEVPVESKITHQSAEFRQPVKMVVDKESNRAFILDYSYNRKLTPAVIAVDLETGVQTIVSDNDTHPSDVALGYGMSDITFDSKRNRALILHAGAIIAVDASTGKRDRYEIESFSDASSLSDVRRIAFDNINDKLWVMTAADIVVVDVETWMPTLVEDTALTNGTFNILNPAAIEVDPLRNKVLIAGSADGQRALVSVDMSTGDRAIVSNRNKPNAENLFGFSSDVGIAIDAISGRIFVADTQQSIVYEIDPTSGKRSLLAFPSSSQTFPQRPKNIFYDADLDRLLILDLTAGSLVAFDMKSQTSSLVTEIHTNGSEHLFLDPDAIGYDVKGDKIVFHSYIDRERGLMSVDANSGDRDPLIQSGWRNRFGIQGLVLDEENSLLYINGGTSRTIESINLVTGEQKIVSGPGIPDYSNLTRDYSAFEFDKKNNRLIAVDTAGSAIHLIDLVSGERRILSDNTTPNANHPMRYPLTMDYDEESDRLFVVDFSLGALFEIDMKSGARQLITGSAWPNTVNVLSAPRSVAYDALSNRAIVVDSGLRAIVAVDVSTGIRTIISDNTHTESAILLSSPTDIKLGKDENIAYIVDRGNNTFISVDLSTGLRVKLFEVDSPEQFVMTADNSHAFITQSSPGALFVYDFEQQSLSEIEEVLVYRPLSALAINEKEEQIIGRVDRDFVSLGLAGKGSTTIPRSSELEGVRPVDRIVITSTGKSFYVMEYGNIYEIQIESGEPTVIFQKVYGGQFQGINYWDFAMADSLNSLVMVGRDSMERSAIFKLDLATFEFSVLSDHATPTSDNALQSASQVVVDQSRNRALVYDSGLNAIISVNLVDGSRTVLSGPQTPNTFNPILQVNGMTIDTKRNRLILSQYYLPGLMSIDMETGQRVYISR